MNIVKSTVLFLLLAVGLSSCLVAGPGYGYRRGPGYYRGGGGGGYHGGGGHHGGGGYHGGGGGGHYRR